MRRTLRLVLGTMLTLGLAVSAWAAAGELKTPGVALPEKTPEATKAAIKKALNRKDCTFLGGMWLNSFTSLRYRGDTLAANLFMEELAKCPGQTVSIRFRKLDEEWDWRVSHMAWDGGFGVEINLNSPRLDIEKLVVPDAKGPAEKAPPAAP
jgi:hypothetical protein